MRTRPADHIEVNNEIRILKYYPNKPWEKRSPFLAGLVECYRDTFATEPWGEWLKCPLCGKHWGIEDRGEVADNNYEHCGLPLADFWPRRELINEIEGEINSKDASCFLARGNRQGIIGFCWGYPARIDELEVKLGIKFGEKVAEFRDGNIAYQDEVGVTESYRGQGIAKAMVRLRLQHFLHQGLTYGVVRTRKSPHSSVTYEWYTKKLGYQEIATYVDGRVVLGRELQGLESLLM